MGRRRKMDSSKNRSFRLTESLLENIKIVAEKRGKDGSDVVREVLEENIHFYLTEAELIRLNNLRDSIKSLKNDAELATLFRKYKDKKELIIPLNAGLDSRKMMLLMDAITAHKTLPGAKPAEEWVSEPIVAYLNAELPNGVDRELQKHVLRLRLLGKEPWKLKMIQDDTGRFILKTGRYLQEQISDHEFHYLPVNSLRFLIKLLVFELIPGLSSGESHYVTYSFNPKKWK